MSDLRPAFDELRLAYTNAAFEAGRLRAQIDPSLNFCFADAVAMADAAVAVALEGTRAATTALSPEEADRA